MPFIETDNCKFYCETCGTGEPLVLLHGLAADSASWLPVREHLSAKYTLIMPDNRISGRSVCRRPPEIIADLAADVKTLLDRLGVKKAVIAGHSMGGYVAQEFAAMFPERVSALILESTAAVSSKRNNALFAAFADMLDKDGYTETFWRVMFPWLVSPAIYEGKPDLAELAIKAALNYPYLPSVENFRRLGGIIAAHDARARLGGIKARCLVISGGHDMLITSEESRALADGIPGARFAFAKNAGHIPHFELPDVFAQTVTVFLSQSAQTPNETAPGN